MDEEFEKKVKLFTNEILVNAENEEYSFLVQLSTNQFEELISFSFN